MIKEILLVLATHADEIKTMIASVDNAIKELKSSNTLLLNKTSSTDSKIDELFKRINELDAKVDILLKRNPEEGKSVAEELNSIYADVNNIENNSESVSAPTSEFNNPTDFVFDQIDSFKNNSEDTNTTNNDVADFFSSLSEKELSNIKSNKQPSKDSISIEEAVNKLRNKGIEKKLNDVDFSNVSFDNIFGNHTEKPEQKTFTIPTPQRQPQQNMWSNTNTMNMNMNNNMNGRKNNNVDFGIDFDQATKSLIVTCYHDNSQMGFRYGSEGFDMIVNKLRNEHRNLSSLTDRDIHEFLKTVISREIQLGINTRGYGESFQRTQQMFSGNVNPVFSPNNLFY